MAAPIDVLVVDDEPKIRQVLEQILTARGCAVRVAQDGLDALAQFTKQPANVVVTDIKMPRMNGIELLRELKRLDPLLNVVVITAFPSVEGAVQAMQHGACDFITKPFDIAQIQAILYRCQQRMSLTRQLRTAGEGMLKLEELNRRLAELNDLKSQFLAALSHEINTPLCLMSEWIYLLSDETLGPLSGDQRKALDVIIQAYGRLHHLLQQLIDLMHGHEIVLQRHRLPLQELVQEALELVRPKAEAKKVTVQVALPNEPLVIDADRQRVRAALEYVLDNAIRFNQSQGRVDIGLGAEGDTVFVEVRDTGMGIPADEQEKVFQAFYQVDRRLNRAHDGAGIGLTLTRRYVELHGGSVALSSEPDKGTRVVLRFPKPSASATLPGPLPSPI
jgi:signal transduction histidine kinase